MTSEQLIQFFKFLCKANGVKKSNIFFRWSVFAYPIWSDRAAGQVAFKVMAYKGVDSSKMRVAKMACGHALTCLVAGVGAGASGLGELGSSLEGVNKFGALKNAFGVDIGGVQLATVLEDGSRTPKQVDSAIVASGKLLHRAIIRVDSAGDKFNVYYRDATDASICDLYMRLASQMNGSGIHIDRRYTLYPNGLVATSTGFAGNYKTRKVH